MSPSGGPYPPSPWLCRSNHDSCVSSVVSCLFYIFHQLQLSQRVSIIIVLVDFACAPFVLLRGRGDFHMNSSRRHAEYYTPVAEKIRQAFRKLRVSLSFFFFLLWIFLAIDVPPNLNPVSILWFSRQTHIYSARYPRSISFAFSFSSLSRSIMEELHGTSRYNSINYTFSIFLSPLAATWRKQVHPSFLLCRTFFLFGQCARRVFAEEKRWRCISYLIRYRMMKWNNKKWAKCAPNRRKSSPPFFLSLSISTCWIRSARREKIRRNRSVVGALGFFLWSTIPPAPSWGKGMMRSFFD